MFTNVSVSKRPDFLPTNELESFSKEMNGPDSLIGNGGYGFSWVFICSNKVELKNDPIAH